MPKTETKIIEEMCWLLEDPHQIPYAVTPSSLECQVLASSLFAAKTTTKPWGVVPQRVFIQDLAASLNRRRLLPNEKVSKFEELGYEYMTI